MSSFETRHGGGETYKKYDAIQSSLTPQFKELTFEMMVETYIRDQMGRKYLSDTEFDVMKASWHFFRLRDIGEYPYDMEKFPHAHPYTRAAAIEGKKRLGIEL